MAELMFVTGVMVLAWSLTFLWVAVGLWVLAKIAVRFGVRHGE